MSSPTRDLNEHPPSEAASHENLPNNDVSDNQPYLERPKIRQCGTTLALDSSAMSQSTPESKKLCKDFTNPSNENNDSRDDEETVDIIESESNESVADEKFDPLMKINKPTETAGDAEIVQKMFKTLSIETDINVAPANWMRGDIVDRVTESSYWSVTDAPELSSIRMAATHSWKLLSADLISDSRNIKKLLKMDRDKEEVSMAVHRIGNTLLVDEFPIERYIPQRQEKMTKKKKKKKKSSTHVNTISKFLYHTILHNNYITGSESNVIARKNSIPSTDIMVGMGDPLSKISLEVPQILDTKSYPSTSYNRTVYWEFEDIQMLLGNNMPIFGGGEYPAISLKLCDMKEPINVLTGIDCWLDNLICNVPELAMCWHLDGFVQGYELYKTEEIPNLENCKFDPVVIKDLASNVLKFLKARCVKEGHTYWLYRAKGDDIVKLYDLSSICTGINLTEINPFSIPVAMLCFKVAQRLYEEGRSEDRSTIYTLLQNTLNLIPLAEYPQMSGTAHFMIADLFLSNSFQLSHDKKIKLTVQPLYECQFENLRDVCECSIERDLLDSSWGPPLQLYYWKNIATDLNSQKKMSLKHIICALEQVNNQTDSWAVKLQKLLLFKASAIFLHESETGSGSVAFTNALLSLITLDAYNNLLYSKDTLYQHGYGYEKLLCVVLCRVADVLLNQIASPSGSRSSTTLSTLDNILLSFTNCTRSFDVNCAKIFEQCYSRVPDGSLSKRVISTKFETREVCLLLCLDLYLEASHNQKELTVKKLGFVYNELASYNLNLISLEESIQQDVAKELLKQSFEHFKSALGYFTECCDVHNIALIYSNLGKVMRLSGQLQARFHYGNQRGALLFEEREFYKEAIGYYNEALDTLRKPSVQKDIWCTVSNELSGVYFSMANILQDYSAANSGEDNSDLVREVTNFYNKSLTISQGLVREGFTQASGLTGCTHHKLASLYHAQARDTWAVPRKRKRLFGLAETNYQQALSYFKEDGFEMEYIQGVMEYVGLLQYLALTPSSAFATCCELLGKLRPFILSNHEMVLQSRDTVKQIKMLSLLKDQILSLLKSIVIHIKQGKSVVGFVCDSSHQPSASSPSNSETVGGKLRDPKVIYAQALRCFQVFNPETGVQSILDQVINVLTLLDYDS